MTKIWKSKTIAANVAAIALLTVESMVGYPMPPEAQAYILAMLNVALRIITNDARYQSRHAIPDKTSDAWHG